MGSTAFNRLKEALTSAPILHSPIWGDSFELMCDASNCAVVVVLKQCVNRKPHGIVMRVILLNEAQLNYTVNEKEFLAVVLVLKISTLLD